MRTKNIRVRPGRSRVSRHLLLALAVLASAWPVAASEEVFYRAYPLATGGTFKLSNVNGSVEVSGWEKEQVEIHAVKSARWRSEDLQQVTIEVSAGPGAVAVRTRYPGNEGVQVDVDYHVHVPYRVLSTIETVNGSVRVAGVEGRGQLRSVNGNVEVLDSAGRFSARTTNGNVHLELRRLAEGPPISIATMNGSVVLALPSGASADLDVHSFNGDFHSELPAVVQGSLGSRRFRARLGAGGSVISIQTVNGGIRVLAVRPAV